MRPTKNLITIIFFLFFIGLFVAGEPLNLSSCLFPAVYNFGDSNSDTSAEMYIADTGFDALFEVSTSYVPLDGKPKRKYSDGRLILDFIAENLQIPYLSAYLDRNNTDYKHGSNFAVGGAVMYKQMKFYVPPDFATEITRFTLFKNRTIQGTNISNLPMPEDFTKSLYTIDLGQNDVNGAMQLGKFKDIPDMINSFAIGVKNLYDEGARSFWIHNTGPFGCLPSTINNPDRVPSPFDAIGCLQFHNDVSKEFNKQLKSKVVELRAELKEAALIYVDVYCPKYKLFSNAKNLGFSDPFGSCVSKNSTCEDPGKYISWDGTHYTEYANRLVAADILNGSFSDPPLAVNHACHGYLTA